VNLSIWYKLNDLTRYAAFLTITGAIITVLANLLFVPKYGYYAAAWAHSAAYFIMVVMSYGLGRKFYPVPYHLKKLIGYFMLAMMLFIVAFIIKIPGEGVQLIFNNMLIIVFVLIVYFKEVRHKFASRSKNL
jgi:O-antigen/teichoic acid export membrane protein